MNNPANPPSNFCQHCHATHWKSYLCPQKEKAIAQMVDAYSSGKKVATWAELPGHLKIAYQSQAQYERKHGVGKQERYQDATGEDWIDEAARTFTTEEFRGAMRFSIGKYSRRMGKKDEPIKEIEKMRDYCERWLEVEKGRQVPNPGTNLPDMGMREESK